jgi:hypothetical protein
MYSFQKGTREEAQHSKLCDKGCKLTDRIGRELKCTANSMQIK